MDTPPGGSSPGLLTETLQTVSASSTPVKVEMVLRIWSPSFREADAAPDGPPLPQHAGLLAFIEDVVATRQGQLKATRSQLSIWGLTKPADALVVARRIQLGLQGFRSKPGTEPVAVSIAIDSSSHGAVAAPAAQTPANGASDPAAPPPAVEPSHDLLTLLKLSKPAQVLVTHDLCQRSTTVKCLPMKSFPARFGIYEYLWTSQDKLELLEAEPQLTLVSLPAAPPATVETKPAVQPDRPAAAEPGAEAAGAEQPPAKMVFDWRAALHSPRVAVFGALIVVVAAIASFVGYRLTHEPVVPAVLVAPNSAPGTSHAANPGSQPASQSTTQQAGSSSAGQSATPAAAQTSDSNAKPAAPSKHSKDQRVATKPSAPTAECNLPGSVSNSLDLAEQARGGGDYSRAIRLFNQVLACDPNNSRAKTGLERAYSGQHQSQRQQ